MWEVKWTRRGCSKPREKIQESKALQKTTLQTSCSTSSKRKNYPHVLGITRTAMNLEIDLCSKLDFLHRCLEHIVWILAVACCFFVSKAFNHVLLKLWTPMPAWISLTALFQGGTVLCFTTGNKWTERYRWTPNSCPLFESYQHAEQSRLAIMDTRWRRHVWISTLLRACTHCEFGGGLFSQPPQLFHMWKNIFLKWKRFSIGS